MALIMATQSNKPMIEGWVAGYLFDIMDHTDFYVDDNDALTLSGAFNNRYQYVANFFTNNPSLMISTSSLSDIYNARIKPILNNDPTLKAQHCSVLKLNTLNYSGGGNVDASCPNN